MLCEIAESQGLHIKIGKYLKGGQTFGQHMGIEESRKARQVRGYDYAFLQDQSVNPARLARDKNEAVLTDYIKLKDEVLEYSPDCKIFLERTWGYPGNKAGDFGTWLELDKYLKKGTSVVVHGRIQTGSYTNKDGIKVHTIEVLAEGHDFAGRKNTGMTNVEPPKEENGIGQGSSLDTDALISGHKDSESKSPDSIPDGFTDLPEDEDDVLPFN